VPVDAYESARNALGTLGEMTGSEKSEDVTGQLADMDGRIGPFTSMCPDRPGLSAVWSARWTS